MAKMMWFYTYIKEENLSKKTESEKSAVYMADSNADWGIFYRYEKKHPEKTEPEKSAEYMTGLDACWGTFCWFCVNKSPCDRSISSF